MRPVYQDDLVTLYHGDCREFIADAVQSGGGRVCVVTDPPYGDTPLAWDVPVREWLEPLGLVANALWCFGSMRFWLEHGGAACREAGWKYGQEIVWEKHNGSSFHADRFKRVHEFAVHWYRGEWSALHKEPPVTLNATPRTVRRKHRPPHTGHIEASSYRSEDGGPKLMRSVLQVRSEHGRAVHPTQKPLGILRPLISYSCPVDGTVFDPFAGSASTLIAARELGRRAVGIEIDAAHCDAAVRRLAQAPLNFGEAA